MNSLTAQYEALADKQSEEALSVKAALDAAAADLANQQQALSAAKATYDAEKQAVLSDSAKRQMELAQVPSSLSVQSAKEDLARGRDGVTAPISGVVTSLSAVPGSSAAAYGPLCTIQSLSDVYVDVALSRYDLEKVKPGQSAVVTTLGRTYTGTVASIDAMGHGPGPPPQARPRPMCTPKCSWTRRTAISNWAWRPTWSLPQGRRKEC